MISATLSSLNLIAQRSGNVSSEQLKLTRPHKQQPRFQHKHDAKTGNVLVAVGGGVAGGLTEKKSKK